MSYGNGDQRDGSVSAALAFAISAMFLGLGLGRFAFSPLIPELVGRGWLGTGAAQSIAAANLVGYFFGALVATRVSQNTTERTTCLMSGALVVFSYAMLLWPIGETWFWLSRFAAGVGGALLMVVGTAAAGRQLASFGRKQLQPMVFVGIGLGVLFVAVCLPQLLAQGLQITISALLAFSGGSFAVLWINSGFLRQERRVAAMRGRIPSPGWPAMLIIVAYGCDALGFVMHTIYLPDMLRRAYGHTEAEVAASWACFGIGACLAPAFVMLLRRAFGGLDALWLAFILKAGGVGLVLVAADPVTASVSLFVVGMLTPGLVMLTSGALSTSAPPDRYLGLWAGATATFALCQMVSGVVISSGHGYEAALVFSVSILAFGAVLAFAARCVSDRKSF